MNTDILLYIATMALVTYLIRMLPLTLIRKPIKNAFIRSFLFYVPYVTLTVMTVPGIFSSTGSVWSAALGFVSALAVAWSGQSLIVVSLSGAAAVFLSELAGL